MREDGFVFMEMPDTGSHKQPAYLVDVEDDSPTADASSAYTAVDHAALARENDERIRDKSVWEKLRSGQAISVDDLPFQGAIGGSAHQVLGWMAKPVVLVVTNTRVLMLVGVVLVALLLATSLLTEWIQWLFTDMY